MAELLGAQERIWCNDGAPPAEEDVDGSAESSISGTSPGKSSGNKFDRKVNNKTDTPAEGHFVRTTEDKDSKPLDGGSKEESFTVDGDESAPLEEKEALGGPPLFKEGG